MGYFQNIKNLNELRNAYKKLLIKFHPDNNPQMDTTNIMQEINAEYDALLQRFKSSSEYTSSAEADFNDDELKHILNELVKLNADIVIEIIGTWIWVKGNTLSKASLKHYISNGLHKNICGIGEHLPTVFTTQCPWSISA